MSQELLTGSIGVDHRVRREGRTNHEFQQGSGTRGADHDHSFILVVSLKAAPDGVIKRVEDVRIRNAVLASAVSDLHSSRLP